MKKREEEGDRKGSDEGEMWSKGGEEEDKDDDNDEVQDEDEEDMEKVRFLIDSEGETMAPEPRSPFGHYEMEEI